MIRLTELLVNEGENREVPKIDAVRQALGSLSTTLPPEELPVRAETSEWQVLENPNRLVKNFQFSKFKQLDFFLNELLKYQEEVQHHAKIIVDHREITVETFTRDINSVTKQDKNLSKFCDELYDDISFFNLNDSENTL